MVFGFQGKNTGLNLHPNCGQKGLDRPDREKIYKLLEESASKDWQALAYHEDRRKYKQALAVTYKKILALIPNTEQIEELRAELKNVMAQRDLTWRELEEVKKIKGEQIDAMLVEARRTAKKQEREEEAFNIQCCVADAKRVYPNWTIDDVLELLEFREKTRQALKEG